MAGTLQECEEGKEKKVYKDHIHTPRGSAFTLEGDSETIVVYLDTKGAMATNGPLPNQSLQSPQLTCWQMWRI